MLDLQTYDSGMVMYPSGHARNTTANLEDILHNKFRRLGELAVGEGGIEALLHKLADLHTRSAEEISCLYSDFKIHYSDPVDE